jgi:hypothetical protein
VAQIVEHLPSKKKKKEEKKKKRWRLVEGQPRQKASETSSP